MTQELTNAQIRKLKAFGQRLEPVLRIGKAGLSEPFLKSVVQELALHELIKVKFAEFKEEKKQLAPTLAAKTGSVLIMRVGNVVVLYRQHPDPAQRRVPI